MTSKLSSFMGGESLRGFQKKRPPLPHQRGKLSRVSVENGSEIVHHNRYGYLGNVQRA